MLIKTGLKNTPDWISAQTQAKTGCLSLVDEGIAK